jgi:hypothetical protein
MGKSVTEIGKLDHMPSDTTIWNWLRRRDDFFAAYVRARAIGTEAGVEDLEKIAKDGSGDWIELPDGRRVLDAEHVQRSKLRVETKKWALARYNPKRWGDRVDMHVTQDESVPSTMTDAQLERQMTALLAKGFGAKEAE